MKCVLPSPEGTCPHSIGNNFTGFVNLFLGEINLEIISSGTEPIIPNKSIRRRGSNAEEPTNSLIKTKKRLLQDIKIYLDNLKIC